MRVFRFVLAAVLILSFRMGYASVAPITEVRHLGLSDGLSGLRVFSILEDRNGAIWISTKSGVDRYNGNQITNYTLPGDLYYGDMAGRVIQLYYDGLEELWAYDNTGRIYLYSEVYDRFDHVAKVGDAESGDVRLNRIFRSDSGENLLGMAQGLFSYDKEGGVTPIITDVYVNDIAESDSALYVATTSGLKVIGDGCQSGTVKGLENENIQSLCVAEESGLLLIGTFNDGLFKMDLDTREVSRFESVRQPFSYPVRAILKISECVYAAGADGGGIYTLDLNDGTVELLINTESDNKNYLYSNGIYTMCRDMHGNVWVGSYTGGVTLIGFVKAPLEHIVHERGNTRSIANNNVNAIAENVNGDIWYATDCGVSVFRQGSGQWFHRLSGSVGVTLCPSGDGNVLLGTYGAGVFMLDKDGNVVRHIDQQSGGLTSNYIFSIEQDGDGDYWVGAIDGKLMLLDSDGVLKCKYDVGQVLSVEILEGTEVAASTANGFYVIEKMTGEIRHYASTHEQQNQNLSTYIIPMLFNGDGTVWLGTEGGGLNLYDMGERKVRRAYRMSDGLPSNDIYGIQQDTLGRLWISTGNGISVIADSTVSSINYIVGKGSEYNKSASAVLSGGDFVFGSTAGAVRFSPYHFDVVDYSAPLRISGFSLDAVDEAKRERLVPYVHDGLKSGKLLLDYDCNSFTVSFEAINIRYSDDISYRYFLEGYDNGWSELTDMGVARYKNVAPGKYTLFIRSVRGGDNRIIDEASLSVRILQPWWNTVWAWLAYTALALLIIGFAFRYKWNMLQKRYDQDKIRFFINTAHDIRTPVTLIMSPLEELLKEETLSSNALYLAEIAKQNVGKLNSIASQLLDFEKFESGQRRLELVTVDLCEILRDEVGCFLDVCAKKGIELTLSLPDAPACIAGDGHLLEQLFDNLMSNACKYTRSGGFVKVSVSVTRKRVTVDISDNGIGIPQKGRKHIFTDVYRAKNARDSQEAGTGFGLLQVKRIVKMLDGTVRFTSTEGEGTTFTVAFRHVFDEPVPFSRKTSAGSSLEEVMLSDAFGVEKREGHTILIVDDNDDMRNYLRKAFSKDFNVAVAHSATEASVYLGKNYPDLILSDVVMPDLHGDDFCRMVKSNPDTAGIPVILLTANSDHKSVVTGLQKGADDYITKPFSMEILKLKVKGMIENRNNLREGLLRHAIDNIEPGNLHVADVEASESDRDFVAKVTDVVVRNMDDMDFSIDQLCQEMAMSRTLFYGRLKSLTGKAPQEFIRILRLNKAAELLKQGIPVIEVSEMVGFVNVKYFSTLFKKHFGVQPSKYCQ